MKIHKCEQCGHDVPRAEATMRGNGHRILSWCRKCRPVEVSA